MLQIFIKLQRMNDEAADHAQCTIIIINNFYIQHAGYFSDSGTQQAPVQNAFNKNLEDTFHLSSRLKLLIP